MKTKIRRLASTTILLSLLIVTSNACSSGSMIKASKNYITKDVQVTHFKAIQLTGSMDMEFTQDQKSQNKVQIYGSDNLVDLLEVKVENQTLVIKFIDPNISFSGDSRLKVKASGPELIEASLKGSGNISIKGELQTDKLNLNLTGSGDIQCDNIICSDLLTTTLNGSGDLDLHGITQAPNILFSLTGSGDLKVKSIISQEGSVNLKGSGDLSIYKNCRINNLKTNLTGSGDLKIKGINATLVNASLLGSGDITLEGETNEATLSLDNSGTIHANDLKSLNVIATVKGSGDISCYPIRKLKISVKGSGDISHRGTPESIELFN